MELKFKKTMAIVVLSVLAFTCYAEDEPEPNKPDISKADLTTESSEVELTTEPVPEGDKSTDQIEAELAREYYKDCVQNLKWALGIIVGLVVVLFGFVSLKGSKEHRETLADAKEALREARSASDKARDYEEKAHERLRGIDKEVTSKLKEIEEKGRVLVSELIQEAEKQRKASREEAEKQRKISELWNEGLRAVKDEDFESAANYFGKIVKDLKVENPSVYYNWGYVLSKLAKRKEGAESDELSRQSFEKYQKSVEIKPDQHEAYDNWGNTLSELAKKKVDQERSRLLEEAKRKCLEAESIKKGSGAYNLACVSALLGDEKECERWLKIGEEAGTLITREKAMMDADFESVRDKEWFKQIRWADDAK